MMKKTQFLLIIANC